ncbi:MAG: ABC transporter permease [Actinobacteria bacterium]|nr:ABC transporter permease [Cyanobacteriota bacterium]MCL5772539.1 ABC transporter permease [Actinomycetota bacterium]
MSNFTNPVIVIAKREYIDTIKNKLFLTLIIFILLLTIVSITVSSLDFQGKVTDYKNSIQILKNLGKTSDTQAAPQFYPLQMLRGIINYLEIIGAILGIILGYLSIAKEKGKRTLQLILSRPVKRSQIISGKISGNSLLIISILTIVLLFIFLIIREVAGVILSFSEITRVVLTLLFSFIYIMFFFCLSFILALKMKVLTQALIICLVIWLVFVLIIPQIGDTMDPDNQIPGGFFQSLNINKLQEKEIMSKFHTYETTRNAVEESSITKHYERISFALLGIKDTYNGKNLHYIFKDRWMDPVWLLSFLMIILFLQYFVLLNKNTVSWEN